MRKGTSPRTLRGGVLTLALVFAILQSISVTWTNNSAVQTGFEIERRIGATDYSLLTTTNKNAREYKDKNVERQILYCYRVRAVKNQMKSEASNEACSVVP